MTPIAAKCSCGRDADTAQLGWGWCRDCYYDLMLIVEMHTANPRPRTPQEKGSGKPKGGHGPRALRDTAATHDRWYHGGIEP